MAAAKLSPAEIAKLYERHGAALTAYACTFVNDFASAEDVVHQLFLKLLRTEIAMPDTPIAYLYRAVKNNALNAIRAGSRDTSLNTETQAPIFEHRQGNREASIALQSALSELPAEQREALIMRIWSGLTLEEVAAATNVSVNTAASRYRYSLEKLRERLKPYQTISVSGKSR
ncbi:MAG TPA: RNA polymerase sigma factor [Candidatus Dormibacteraeota bacterium]|nr:RNA polymerase sigma factor [Candidatus Dormibacteraeota bacterium]